MMDKFSQFLSEKFLYDQSIAMDLLVQCGLKEQLFDLAKVRTYVSHTSGVRGDHPMVLRGSEAWWVAFRARNNSRLYVG